MVLSRLCHRPWPEHNNIFKCSEAVSPSVAAEINFCSDVRVPLGEGLHGVRS